MRCTIAASLQMSDEPEFFPQKTRDSYRHKKEDISFEISSSVFESLLSDSNQRPRDYKSRALASWAKEAGGKALHIAPLQLTTFAAIKPWRIRKELAVWHFPMWWNAFLLVCTAKERIYFESTKFQCIFLIITHQNPLFRLPQASFFIFRTDSHSPFTQKQTFSASNICLLKSTSSRSMDCSRLSTYTLHAIWPHNHQPQYDERKETRK